MVSSIESGAEQRPTAERRMGTVRIAPADLAGLDTLKVDAVALPMFELVAQPRSVAGYIDWRLSGRLSRLLREKRFQGRPEETLLMSALGRFGADRIFLMGLGRPQPPNKMTDVLRAQASTLFEAGARVLAVAPPTPVVDDVTAPAFLIRWLEALAGTQVRFDEVVLLDPSDELLMAQDGLHSASNKAGMTWEG